MYDRVYHMPLETRREPTTRKADGDAERPEPFSVVRHVQQRDGHDAVLCLVTDQKNKTSNDRSTAVHDFGSGVHQQQERLLEVSVLTSPLLERDSWRLERAVLAPDVA